MGITVDVTFKSMNKYTEILCGDTVECLKTEENRTPQKIYSQLSYEKIESHTLLTGRGGQRDFRCTDSHENIKNAPHDGKYNVGRGEHWLYNIGFVRFHSRPG